MQDRKGKKGGVMIMIFRINVINVEYGKGKT